MLIAIHSYSVHPAYLRIGSDFLMKDSRWKMPKIPISSIIVIPPHLRRPATANAAPLTSVVYLVSLSTVKYLVRYASKAFSGRYLAN